MWSETLSLNELLDEWLERYGLLRTLALLDADFDAERCMDIMLGRYEQAA